MALNTVNTHLRDLRIVFNDKNHTYTIDNNSKDVISVSTLVKTFFPKFDAKKVITNMKRKFNFELGEYKNMTDEEIEKKWKLNGEQASSNGINIHKQIENYYNGINIQQETEEFKSFLKFHEVIKDRLTPYRTEWPIFRDKKDTDTVILAGELDMLYKIAGKNNDFELIDWKVIKELKYENKYEKGYGCLNHLDNCNYNHYSLQLNLYKTILEENYGISIVNMSLVILKKDSYEVVNIKNMTKEISELLMSALI